MSGEAVTSPVRRIGRYALYSEIASGGMATVYLGRQRGQAGFARTVAIKRLHPQFAKEPDFVAMFLDEARLAARIRHPNVVPTLDVVALDGELFLVMEYVQGESLSRLLRATRQRKENAPPRVVAAIVADVLHGLHAAHEATSEKGEPLGLVHRDVSPHNVLVGADGVTRVVDFGVAKAAGRIQTTREGQLKGKIAYMAPEQISSVASRRTDVYAASVVLWEALTARRLFHGENDANVLNQVMNAKVPPPSQHVPELDPAWDEIVLKGLEREEERRWATAREMAVAIETRLPLARATEVGEWVESLARESLAKRAADVTSVESASDVEPVPAEPVSVASTPASVKSAVVPVQPPASEMRPTIPDPPAAPAESTGSRISAVSWPLHQTPPPRRRSRAAIVVAAVVVGAGAVATWVVVSTRPATQGKEAPAATAAAATEPASAPATSSAAPSAVPTAVVSAAPAVARPTRPARGGKLEAPAASKAPGLGGLLDTRR